MTNQITLNKRVHLFGVDIDPLTMRQAVGIITQWLKQPEITCKFVVTPNVDHVVKVQTDMGLQAAYKQAALVVTDGKPVVWAARLLGANIPGTVPGSDLASEIFEFAQTEKTLMKVFLLGAMPGVADRAKVVIQEKWPVIEVVGTLSPDFGFDKNEAESKLICKAINDSGAELLVLGLSGPKQEIWITKYSPEISVKVALCVGAAIDFLSGEKIRAPMWMRNAGLEWLHRVLSEPRRLARRYIVDGIVFPRIVFREWFKRQFR